MYIRRNFPHDRAHGGPTRHGLRHGHNRELAIITTRHPGPLTVTFSSKYAGCLPRISSLSQPDSVHTVQDALAHVSRPRFAQAGPSGPGTGIASQQVTVLIEALPPVLVLHLKRFSYDAATGGVVKNSKPVLLSSELEIPPGTAFLLPPSP
jgi:hypothetical protein